MERACFGFVNLLDKLDSVDDQSGIHRELKKSLDLNVNAHFKKSTLLSVCDDICSTSSNLVIYPSQIIINQPISKVSYYFCCSSLTIIGSNLGY